MASSSGVSRSGGFSGVVGGGVLRSGLEMVTAGVRELSSVMRACAMSLPIRV